MLGPLPTLDFRIDFKEDLDTFDQRFLGKPDDHQHQLDQIMALMRLYYPRFHAAV